MTRTIFRLGLLVALSYAVIEAPLFAQNETNSAPAEVAWKELEKAMRPPVPPAEWGGKQPSPDQIAKFRDSQRALSGAAADQAKDFYTRFPTHPKAVEARTQERKLLGFAVQLGDTNRIAQLERMDEQDKKNPNLTDEERFSMAWEAMKRAAGAKRSEGEEAMLAVYEKSARTLQKEFPQRKEVYQIWMMLLSESEGEKARGIADELIKGINTPAEIKTMATGLLKKMDALGKPVNLQFSAVDGRKVDLSKMLGKVVLIDFWATWCGPCIAALPELKDAYAKLQAKGFEVIGISLDSNKEQMLEFIAEEKMDWPQYFDGLKWENKLAREFGVNSIPAVWLVDKKGMLRDQNARGDLEKKVEKLLAE